LFQKYRTHLCICNQCKDKWVFLQVYRGSMDTEVKVFVEFNENSHHQFWICNVYSLEFQLELKKIKSISDLPTLILFHYVSGNTTFFVWPYQLDHCNSHTTCKTPISNNAVEFPVLSTCLSVGPDLKTARRWSTPLHIESVERYTCHLRSTCKTIF
jgi:hypothetical protein